MCLHLAYFFNSCKSFKVFKIGYELTFPDIFPDALYYTDYFFEDSQLVEFTMYFYIFLLLYWLILQLEWSFSQLIKIHSLNSEITELYQQKCFFSPPMRIHSFLSHNFYCMMVLLSMSVFNKLFHSWIKLLISITQWHLLVSPT